MSKRGSHTAETGGLIRTPARPPGWRAPGPPPADAATWGPHLPRRGEDLCFLSGDWRILQRLDGHRFSLDDLMTAWVASAAMADRPVRRTLDLGCGIGSVLMMVAWRFPLAEATGIEAQDVSVELARRSVQINGIGHRCRVLHGDLRTTDPAARGPFDLITGTPPYIPLGSGVVSQGVQKGPCRHEFRGGVEDYCAAAARQLPLHGRLVLCQAAADVARVSEGATAAGLAVLARLDVIPRAGAAALLSVYTLAQADAPALPPMRVDRFVVRDAQGARTAECWRMRAEMGFPPKQA